ncbi:type II secretion system protein [Alkalimonas collagenimarina]|uniref:Type II secretion system protein n=1 Tax=Alkalimonas collagenimarina TaxID=400390 RepID=A0ABT9H385_9GAMM|nr:type II secretion system protein [Alkalimonas collagenimarina]MDP4537761.1 type II secretion system protein [Alkalimonas collagenimarina]
MSRQCPEPKGFTLIELVVVMVLLGILAVTLLPRFFTSSGTAEYGYRDQALAIMRLVQLQAMQCTDSTSGLCPPQQLQIASNRLGSSSACINDARHLCIAARDPVVLAASFSTLSFDSMGRPLGCGGACTLQVQGSVSLGICIESEGYIRPC